MRIEPDKRFSMTFNISSGSKSKPGQVRTPVAQSESKQMSGTEICHFVQGEFAISVMSDGYITVPIDIVAPEGSPEERSIILMHTGNPETGLVESKTNIPIIRMGNDLIIVDVGSGNKYQPSDGRLSVNLIESGIDASAVTKVVITHAHPDHLWGTLTEGNSLRFPNATYYIGAAEWDFWMDPDYLTNMPDELHEFARGAQRDLRAIKDRVVMLKPGDDIVTGLRAIDTAGHTPGHLSLEMAGGEGLIISADAATNEIASFQHPNARFGYDTIPNLAICNRARLIERAASERTKLLGYHWTYPGVGFAEHRGTGYRYVPV
jgi:glyoxylase-like metal-dependent hydrolase (beta-lactamase superfamily II)